MDGKLWLRFIENFSLSYFPLYGLPYYEIPPEWAVHHHSERKLFLIQIFIPIKTPDHISFSYVSDYMCLYIPNMHHNQTTWSQMVKIRLAAVSSKFEVVCKIVQHICLNIAKGPTDYRTGHWLLWPVCMLSIFCIFCIYPNIWINIGLGIIVSKGQFIQIPKGCQ